MAKKYVKVCDSCGADIQDGSGATVRATFNDGRRYSIQGDYCDECVGKIQGDQVAKRGRPRAVAAAA